MHLTYIFLQTHVFMFLCLTLYSSLKVLYDYMTLLYVLLYNCGVK